METGSVGNLAYLKTITTKPQLKGAGLAAIFNGTQEMKTKMFACYSVIKILI